MDTFEEAVREAMRQYFRGKKPEKLYKESKGRAKFTKEFFDRQEEEHTGSKTELDGYAD